MANGRYNDLATIQTRERIIELLDDDEMNPRRSAETAKTLKFIGDEIIAKAAAKIAADQDFQYHFDDLYQLYPKLDMEFLLIEAIKKLANSRIFCAELSLDEKDEFTTLISQLSHIKTQLSELDEIFAVTRAFFMNETAKQAVSEKRSKDTETFASNLRVTELLPYLDKKIDRLFVDARAGKDVIKQIYPLYRKLDQCAVLIKILQSDRRPRESYHRHIGSVLLQLDVLGTKCQRLNQKLIELQELVIIQTAKNVCQQIEEAIVADNKKHKKHKNTNALISDVSATLYPVKKKPSAPRHHECPHFKL